MRIIDENGRLFGKINIIDFLVIVFLLSLTPMFYFGYRVFTKKPPVIEPEKEYVKIEIPGDFIKINPEILKLIRVGDQCVDKEGKPIGEITWIGESRPYTYKLYIDNADRGNPIIMENKLLKELPVTLKLKTEVKGNNVYYNDKQILVGTLLDFETNKYKIEFIPSAINKENQDKKERWVQVKVRFLELTSELSNMIERGHIEKDKNGRVVGMLKEIVSKKPSEIRIVAQQEKKLVFIDDPYSKDVIALMNLLCTDEDGILYFKNFPIRIGSQISFTSDVYIISGTIISVINVPDEKDVKKPN